MVGKADEADLLDAVATQFLQLILIALRCEAGGVLHLHRF